MGDRIGKKRAEVGKTGGCGVKKLEKPFSLQKNLDMAFTLNNIPLTFNLDFKAFLLFFEQLPIEHKRLILSALEHKMDEKKQSPETGRSLKGSVISYIMPFEPVARFGDL